MKRPSYEETFKRIAAAAAQVNAENALRAQPTPVQKTVLAIAQAYDVAAYQVADGTFELSSNTTSHTILVNLTRPFEEAIELVIPGDWQFDDNVMSPLEAQGISRLFEVAPIIYRVLIAINTKDN